MTWLVTGGAGYIGAHIVRALHDAGRDVVVLDDLSTGYVERVPAGIPLVRASVLNEFVVAHTLRTYDIAGVIHLAGKKDVAESVTRPRYYHWQNVVGLQRLLSAMGSTGVTNMVFSSSCAVYGDVSGEEIDEASATGPVSPYGRTKLLCENLIRQAGISSRLSWISLRYFNVAGSASPSLGDVRAANLIPMVFRALDEGCRPQIFGADYPTPDGTCIRDYVHVDDIVSAHLACVEHLQSQRAAHIYNIGRGCGLSVREVMALVKEATGLYFEPRVAGRRLGDPASVVACARSIEADLGWTAKRDVLEMVASAWDSWRAQHVSFIGDPSPLADSGACPGQFGEMDAPSAGTP